MGNLYTHRQDYPFCVKGLGFRVQGLGFRVQGLGFKGPGMHVVPGNKYSRRGKCFLEVKREMGNTVPYQTSTS